MPFVEINRLPFLQEFIGRTFGVLHFAEFGLAWPFPDAVNGQNWKMWLISWYKQFQKNGLHLDCGHSRHDCHLEYHGNGFVCWLQKYLGLTNFWNRIILYLYNFPQIFHQITQRRHVFCILSLLQIFQFALQLPYLFIHFVYLREYEGLLIG
jgi:hypothetical protein